MSLPLDGIRVVELGQNYAGPMAAQILAQMGADVVKVERPGSGDDARGWGPPFVDGAAAVFHAVNQNKRAITVDFADAGQLRWLRDYLLGCDVLVQNLRPGVAERLGFSGAALRDSHPRLVYCAMGAYGSVGPLNTAPGYEPILQAFSGLMFQSGENGGPPVRMGTQILDQGTAMWAAIGILGGLAQRARTGRGCSVDASLLETALGWLTIAYAAYGVTGQLPARHPTGSHRLVVFQGFETRNGPLIVAAANDRLFARLAHVLGRAQWADDERFASNAGRIAERDYLLGEIESIMRTRTRGDWLDRLSEAGIPCSPVHDLREATDHPQVQALAMIQSAPGSDFRTMGLPLRFDGERPPLRRPAPGLGEHNCEVVGAPQD